VEEAAAAVRWCLYKQLVLWLPVLSVPAPSLKRSLSHSVCPFAVSFMAPRERTGTLYSSFGVLAVLSVPVSSPFQVGRDPPPHACLIVPCRP